MDGFLLDLRTALRAAQRRPQLTLLTIATLVLGLGANTAIFAVARGTLLRPLPYSDPDGLVMIWQTVTNTTQPRGIATPEMLREYRARNQSFQDIAAVELWTNNPSSRPDLAGEEGAERLRGSVATPNFFNVVGATAALGRTFVEDDNRDVVILSDAFWRRRFAADPAVVGKTIELTYGRARSRERLTVIGVLPPRFRFTYPDDTEVWMLLPWAEVTKTTQQALLYNLVGRLKPGATVDSATADMSGVVASMRTDIPKGGYDRMRVWVEPIHEWSVGRVRPAVRLIAAMTGLLLVIACLNVASLLLAQTSTRRRELALQLTLGASRSRLLRQIFTEVGLMTVVSAVLAVVAAVLVQQLIRSVLPPLMPRADEVTVDLWTVAWTTAIGVATIALAGLLPGIRATGIDPHVELAAGGRTATSGIAAVRLRQTLVALQMGAAAVLLIGGALLMSSLWNLRNVNLGFDGHSVLTQELQLMGPQYRDDARQIAFGDELLARVRRIPGVLQAATTSSIPFRGVDFRRNFNIAGVSERIVANHRPIDPEYFDVMRIPLVEGRLLTPDDTTTSPLVAVVSESMARAMQPNRAIGTRLPFQRVDTSAGKPRLVTDFIEVVGVVGDVRAVRIEDSGAPAVYVPRTQQPITTICLVIRADREAEHIASSVRAAVRDIDPSQPIGQMTTIDDVVARTIADRRFLAIATSAFAVVALLLTVAGLYGVMAIATTERVRELGIRVALGATRAAVVSMLLRQGIVPVMAGVAIGSLTSVWLMRFFTSYLFGIQTIGAPVFTVVAVMVTLGGMAACLFPARAASRVDPMQALRSE